MAFLVTGMLFLLIGACSSPSGQPAGVGGQGGGGTGGQSAAGTGGVGPGAGGGSGGGAGRATGFDEGMLFADAAPVTGSGGSVGGSSDGGPAQPDTGAGGPPGDGNTATCTLSTLGLTAVFTQKGTDVTVVIMATRCPPGTHKIQVHEGFACDDPTNGPVWDGMRGDGIGGAMSTITCGADQRAMLTYTRPGTNPALNWTVGDHNVTTDVTRHPIKVDTNCGTFF